MVDSRWREAERRWRADPGDQQALAAAIEGRRREGLSTPAPMLDAQVFGPTSFESASPFVVEVEREDGEDALVGCTPGRVVKVPRHRAWCVSPARDPWRSYRALDGYERVPDWEETTDASLGRAVEEVAQRSLPGLAIREVALRDHHLRRLGEALVLLDLSRSSLVGSGKIGRLDRLHRLRRLACVDTEGVDLDTVAELPELTNLRTDPETFVALERVPPTLCRLALIGLDLTDQAVKKLGGLEHLTHLDLGNARLSDAGARDVARSAGLVSLKISGASITDRAVRAFSSSLSRLEELHLERCDGITDRGLSSLAKMSRLRVLSLDHCRGVTAKGLAKLAALEGLTRLYVRAGRTLQADRAKARAQLKEALPGCRVY